MEQPKEINSNETYEDQVIPLEYHVYFNNCTINTVKIEQTGKPGSGDPPPGTGGGGSGGGNP